MDAEKVDIWEEVRAAERAAADHTRQVCARIKELRGNKFYKEFSAWLDDLHNAGYCHGHDLVDSKPGWVKPQRIDTIENPTRLKIEYVNQYQNGGITGDSYAGQIWIHIKGKRFFTLYYSM